MCSKKSRSEKLVLEILFHKFYSINYVLKLLKNLFQNISIQISLQHKVYLSFKKGWGAN